jgi:hypothetical protein
MITDFGWSDGLVFGIQHTDTAAIEVGEGIYKCCSGILLHLGFVTLAILFPEDYEDDDEGGTPLKPKNT